MKPPVDFNGTFFLKKGESASRQVAIVQHLEAPPGAISPNKSALPGGAVRHIQPFFLGPPKNLKVFPGRGLFSKHLHDPFHFAGK